MALQHATTLARNVNNFGRLLPFFASLQHYFSQPFIGLTGTERLHYPVNDSQVISSHILRLLGSSVDVGQPLETSFTGRITTRVRSAG